MKKIIAILISAAMLLTAATALAENVPSGQNDRQPPAMSGSSQNGQRPPAMPGGQNSQNGQQPPAMPGGQNGQNGQQPPAMPGGQNDQNGQQPPAMPGGAQKDQPEKRLDFEQLAEDGVIDQELCEKIMEYMKEHAPQGHPDGSAPEEGSQPPALPDGTAPAEGSEPPAGPEAPQGEQGGMEEHLLKELLDSGILTQEQYELLLSKITVTSDAEA